jgi:hypothetical protein
MPIVIDQLDELHARVLLDILETDNNQPVYEGVVPDGATPPYVLVYSSVQWPQDGEGQNLQFQTNRCETRWYVHCAGSTDQSARAISNRVRQLVKNVKPTITGRSCGLIQQEAIVPPIRDERIGVLVMDLVATYVFTTVNG